MPKQPNSDKSGRAQRRRAEREAARPASPPVRSLAPGQFPVNINDLIRKIGLLTVERDFWQERAVQLEQQIQALASPAEEAPEEEPLTKETAE